MSERLILNKIEILFNQIFRVVYKAYDNISEIFVMVKNISKF